LAQIHSVLQLADNLAVCQISTHADIKRALMTHQGRLWEINRFRGSGITCAHKDTFSDPIYLQSDWLTSLSSWHEPIGLRRFGCTTIYEANHVNHVLRGIQPIFLKYRCECPPACNAPITHYAIFDFSCGAWASDLIHSQPPDSPQSFFAPPDWPVP
jgi:hypothetical protein